MVSRLEQRANSLTRGAESLVSKARKIVELHKSDQEKIARLEAENKRLKAELDSKKA